MTEFLYLYRGGDVPMSPADRQQEMQKWMTWMKELGDKGHLKTLGSPLERTGKLVKGKEKVVSDGPLLPRLRTSSADTPSFRRKTSTKR